MNVDIDYNDELEQKTPILDYYRTPTKINILYQLLDQIQQLDDPRRPIAAGVCWDPPYLTQSLDHPMLNRIPTRQGTTIYLLLNQITSPGQIWYVGNLYIQTAQGVVFILSGSPPIQKWPQNQNFSTPSVGTQNGPLKPSPTYLGLTVPNIQILRIWDIPGMNRVISQ